MISMPNFAKFFSRGSSQQYCSKHYKSAWVWIMAWHWYIEAITWTTVDPLTLYWITKPLTWLTHWGRVTHICVSKLSILGSDNGLAPGRRQAIIWYNDGILLIWPMGTNFSEILIEIHSFSFKKIHLKMSSGKWRPFCLGLNVLKHFKVEMYNIIVTYS